MFIRILSFISACVAAISIYEIIVNDAKLYILAGISLLVLVILQVFSAINRTANKTLKHIEECDDENCEIRKAAEEAGLDVPPINKKLTKEDTTYRIREQKLFEKFGKIPEYGEYDMKFFRDGIQKDIQQGYIKNFTQPNIQELENLIADIKDYKARKDAHWYHAQVELKKENENFISRNSKETDNKDSASFTKYQRLVSELLTENTDEITSDSVGGIHIMYI